MGGYVIRECSYSTSFMRTQTSMTTADALRLNESMIELVDAMGIQDPKLRKVIIDQFNEEASERRGWGMSLDQVIAINEAMISQMVNIDKAGLEAAVREECKSRGLI